MNQTTLTLIHSVMDSRLELAARKGDVDTLLALFFEDQHIIGQRSSLTLSTALHIAAKLGHVEFVAKLVEMNPKLVVAQNAVMESAFHEACREGHLEVSKLLFAADPKVAYCLNSENKSALFLACGRGHLQIARSLLGIPDLLESEDNGSSTSLHEAAMGGHIDIVKEICSLRPDLIRIKNRKGRYPVHLSSSKGCLEATMEFLRIDPSLAIAADRKGRTALHLAIIKRRADIAREIIEKYPESAQVLTNDGETVMHLAVKSSQSELLQYLIENTDRTQFLNHPDNKGNTVLHLGVIAKCWTIIIYIVVKAAQFLDVNAVNQSGNTALDIISTYDSTSDTQHIVDFFRNIGAKRRYEIVLLDQSASIERANSHTSRSRTHNHRRNKKPSKKVYSPYDQHQKQREMRLKNQTEGLRNARNTIIIVAVLISTVTFSSGITPPGGVYQDGMLEGKSIAARSTAFKVFMVSNTLALFISLALVTVLVSIIPFRRRAMMVLLVVTHKVMWAAVMFMAVAYIAATWVVMPRGRGTTWLLPTILSISGGVVGFVFVALSVMLVKHWMRKLKWKKQKQRKDTFSLRSNSSVRRATELPEVNRNSTSVRGAEELPEVNRNSTSVRGAEELHREIRMASITSRNSDVNSLELCKETRMARSNSSNSDFDSSEHSGYHTY